MKLSKQSEAAISFKQESNKLKKSLDDRFDLFKKCKPEQQKNWIEKDPVLKEAYSVYRYLYKFFGEVK